MMIKKEFGASGDTIIGIEERLSGKEACGSSLSVMVRLLSLSHLVATTRGYMITTKAKTQEEWVGFFPYVSDRQGNFTRRLSNKDHVACNKRYEKERSLF